MTLKKNKATTDKAKTDTPDVDAEALAVVEGSDEAVAVYRPTAELGQVAGDIDKSDIRFPKLEMVHGVGEASKTFNPGEVVFNQELKLVDKGEPLLMTVLSLTKYYQEALPFDPSGETRPRTFNTKEEVAEAGLWTEWRNNEKPPINECATLLVAGEAPEGIDDSVVPMGFTEENGTQRSIAVAMWTVRNTSYTRVAKQIISAQAFFLKDTLLKGRWELRTSRVTSGDFVVTIPKFKCAGTNTPEYQAFLLECLG